jgi:hypothetical protein
MKGVNMQVSILSSIVFAALLLVLSTSVSSAEESNSGEESTYTEAQCHKKFAVECNNEVWGLLSKESRTDREDERMITAAHASHYHWGRIGEPINMQRGHWLISHVYAVLDKPEEALRHARLCLSLTEEHDFVDFDLAYAYEAMARANASARNRQEAAKYLNMAREAGKRIKAEKDRKLFGGDLQAGPWYGVE